MSSSLYAALIRTHHITSRKKVTKLRAAASNYNIYALIHYGKNPGIMYCQGTEPGVKDWVASVHKLRYKDYQLVKKPTEKIVESGIVQDEMVVYGKVEEVESVREFGARMEGLGMSGWWRKGMGYIGDG